jgi:drug/metabolite transporter (DMT)-like permease
LPDAKAPHLWRVYAVAGLATLVWSINYVAAKWTILQFPPMLLSGLRTCMAAVLMAAVYCSPLNSDKRPELTKKDIFGLAALGIVGVGLNQVFFIAGISRTTVAHAAIIVGLTPILVLVLATIVGHERMKRVQLAGMLLALTGVAVLQFSSPQSRQSSLAGDLMVFCGILMFAVFAVRGKRETTRVGPIVMNTWAYFASAIALLPITLWYGKSFDFSRVTWQGWAGLFYMTAFSSVLGYLLFYYALSHMSASKVSTFAYLQPLIAIGLAIVFLGEQPNATLVSGGALVLAGVYIAERT